jgi:tetratricopeptide (TPR) repeat protein
MFRYRHRMIRVLSGVILLVATLAEARYASVETKQVPVERVIANLKKATKERPDDWGTWLSLGRAHAMASFLASESVAVQVRAGPGDDQLWFGHDPSMVPWAQGQKTVRIKAQLDAALAAYEKANTLKPNMPVVLIGQGWLLDRADRKAEAIEKYRAAFKLSWATDKNEKSVLGTPVSAELISYLRPLLDPKRDAAELAELDKAQATIDRMGRMVTPLAIPLEDGLTSADVRRASPVTFDVDGSGFARSWSWVQPNAGWLVWAPTGRVDSALQLFGSVTFWLFWNDGYQALSALDDDRDGSLSGAELKGLAVWRDANSNGVSEAGELLPLGELGIVALSCRAQASHEAGVLVSNARGVTFSDGHTRPTWDLLLKQVPLVVER